MGIGPEATEGPVSGECAGLSIALERASPNEDESDGGGTEGYVNSRARGSVAGPPWKEPTEVDEAGVVKLVCTLVSPTAGEKGNGEDPESDPEDGGVVLSEGATWVGR